MVTATLPSTFEGMIESKYLKKEDVIPDKLFTIADFSRIDVAKEGDQPEIKWALYFNEVPKPLLLGPTTIQLLKLVLGVNGPTEAIGRKIVLYNDPTVTFGGKLVGGIRLRAPRGQAQPQAAAQGIDKDDIPFN